MQQIPIFGVCLFGGIAPQTMNIMAILKTDNRFLKIDYEFQKTA
jgi:Na+/glutamate symporter